MPADPAITDESIEFLTTKLRGQVEPFHALRSLHSFRNHRPGFRDEAESLFNFSRLWAWYNAHLGYVSTGRGIGRQPTPISAAVAATNFRFYLPYAMGTAPPGSAYRIRTILCMSPWPIYRHRTADDFRDVESDSRRTFLVPGKFGPALLAY